MLLSELKILINTKKYLTEELSNNAVKFIENNSDNPFFLYLSYNAPHTPLQATTKDLDRSIEDGPGLRYSLMGTFLPFHIAKNL